uniref:CCHC-type domain-containing protein n=1 Tax=Peronospora matthiolae TaxID=2874970 RepID=A0AAV1VI23_9STRA
MELLNGTNYTLWAFKMKLFLMSKGLWEAVNGAAAVTAAQGQQAHAAIVLNLSDSQLTHVVCTEDARDAWSALARVHRTHDMASRLWLKEKFASFKYTAPDMTSHVMELEQLVLKMGGAECGPSEEDIFKDLVNKIIAEEVRKKDSSRIEEATALHIGKRIEKSRPTKKNGGQRKKGSNVQCFNCGKRGHFARDCWAKPSGGDEVHEDHSNVAFNVSEDSTSDCWIQWRDISHV